MSIPAGLDIFVENVPLVVLDGGVVLEAVTVKAAAKVPVCVSAFVTTTSRAVAAAAGSIEMLAVIVVEF